MTWNYHTLAVVDVYNIGHWITPEWCSEQIKTNPYETSFFLKFWMVNEGILSSWLMKQSHHFLYNPNNNMLPWTYCFVPICFIWKPCSLSRKSPLVLSELHHQNHHLGGDGSSSVAAKASLQWVCLEFPWGVLRSFRFLLLFGYPFPVNLMLLGCQQAHPNDALTNTGLSIL